MSKANVTMASEETVTLPRSVAKAIVREYYKATAFRDWAMGEVIGALEQVTNLVERLELRPYEDKDFIVTRLLTNPADLAEVQADAYIDSLNREYEERQHQLKSQELAALLAEFQPEGQKTILRLALETKSQNSAPA